MLGFSGLAIEVRLWSEAVLSIFIGHPLVNFASFGQLGFVMQDDIMYGSICGWFY
jgi:hypothetical protein